MLATLLNTALAAATAATAAATPSSALDVEVQTSIPTQCLALYQEELHGSHLLVSSETLTKIVARQADGLPLDERLLYVMGTRAKKILDAAKDAPRDAQGCKKISLASLQDAGYAMVPLIEAGRVAVWSEQHHALVKKLHTKQDQCSLDSPFGGFSVTIEGQEIPFFAIATCIR